VNRPPRQVDTCFLCKPSPSLVYVRCDAGFGLCGLGPLVDGYTVVGSKSHFRSVADLPLDELAPFSRFATNLRNKLSSKFGSCLISEHGRLPVCDYVAGRTESHCYHAHFLMFPCAPRVEDTAARHFDSVHKFSTLENALAMARQSHEYLLLSPVPSDFYVMIGCNDLPRQFARTLVASSIDRPEQADWKAFPCEDDATRIAAELRADLAIRGLNE
jgi:diadenosine tetraphosphate (Ap4A) HIT family hydrolase